MAEHLTDQEIENYRRWQEGPDRASTASHLAVCPACLQRTVKPEDSAIAVSALTEAFLPGADDEPFHLSHSELRNYVEGTVAEADRIIYESHFEICEQCNAKLRSLTTEQTRRAAPRRHTVWTAIPLRLAAAIALIGLLTLAVLIVWQRSSRPIPQESVKTGGPAIPQPAVPPAYVAPTPAVTSSPPAVASLKDNGRDIRLDQEGQITGLEGFDESTQSLIKNALAGGTLAKPRVIDDLSPAPIRLLDDQRKEPAFQLIRPLGKVITEQRPSFSWQPLSGATSYVVGVFDKNFNLIAHSSPLSKTQWTIDAPLQRGQVYSWEVTAMKDGKDIKAPVAPAPSAQFRVAEAAHIVALSKLQQRKPVSHLALGLTYARFGLVNEAEAEFRKLVSENPDSVNAKRLLRTVQAWSR